MNRKPDVVEFYVTTVTKIVVDIDGYVNAIGEGVTGPYLYQGFVKREIPEDRPSFTLDAITVYAEGEFIAEYDPVDNRHVVESDDRVAIVIGAEAAHLSATISDAFQATGGNPSDPAFLNPFGSAAAESVEPVVESV